MSFACCVAQLKTLVADCNFRVLTATSAPAIATRSSARRSNDITSSSLPMLPLDVMLRDNLVCGAQDERVQQHLFTELKLKFLQAFDMFIRLEIGMREQQELKLPKQTSVRLQRRVAYPAPDPTSSPTKLKNDVTAATIEIAQKPVSSPKCRFSNETGYIETTCQNMHCLGTFRGSTRLMKPRGLQQEQKY